MRRNWGKRRYRRMYDGIVPVAFLLLGILIAAKFDDMADGVHVGPFRVVDGDTVSDGDRRLRLEGIDAPELGQTCVRDGGEWPCGQEARAMLARLISSGPVVCRGGQEDRYGRLLVRCFAGDTDLNGEMVRSGMAVAVSSGHYRREEAQAREIGQGLWAGTFDRPQDWRRMRGLADDAGSVDTFLSAIRQFFGWQ